MSDAEMQTVGGVLRRLAGAVTAGSGRAQPARLSQLLMSFVAHDALGILLLDSAGARLQGAGDLTAFEHVTPAELADLQRTARPGTAHSVPWAVGGDRAQALQLTSRGGVPLILVAPHPRPGGVAAALDLWNVVAQSTQNATDIALPRALRVERATSGERLEAVTELADEYSATLESILGALRASHLDDRAARASATALAAAGLVTLRTAADRVVSSAQESVAGAFARLREDLRPIVRYQDLEVEFVEPPADGRPLPSEVARGARAAVRGSILALLDSPEVSRVRVQWDCDGTNLLIDVRDDGAGGATGDAVQLKLVRQRVHALGGSFELDATRGWGTHITIVIPLDPPQTAAGGAVEWGLRPREIDVLSRLAAGRRNREIAAELSISENTVKFHVGRIYRKLHVQSRAEATARYLSQPGVEL
ncbi:helix-turn-helix transcriptional regulator [Microbacterium terrisoli]|uniref:helix-turn-helix transcriptional regulator n=1 Tax=Microbacterium terrisoli TaxID=3242192 RepID=UPI002803AFCB|nr:LuxR C-terminal-related transcriptional regulator [Microbacterium protaetiae]